MPLRADTGMPDDGPRTRSVASGARFDVAELQDGRYQVIIDRGTYFILHAGTAASVRERVAIDADARDRSTIDAALPARAAGGAQAVDGGARGQ